MIKLIRILRKGSWFTSINIVGNSHTTASRCKKPSICSSGTCMELYSYGWAEACEGSGNRSRYVNELVTILLAERSIWYFNIVILPTIRRRLNIKAAKFKQNNAIGWLYCPSLQMCHHNVTLHTVYSSIFVNHLYLLIITWIVLWMIWWCNICFWGNEHIIIRTFIHVYQWILPSWGAENCLFLSTSQTKYFNSLQALFWK